MRTLSKHVTHVLLLFYASAGAAAFRPSKPFFDAIPALNRPYVGMAYLSPSLRSAPFFARATAIISSTGSKEDSEPTTGDALRAATGIRPSLHPTTINSLSEILLIRSTPTLSAATPVDIQSASVEPIKVALSAGRVAAEAIDRRQESCKANGDENMMFTPEEGQAVAGRVVGVTMRLRELEEELTERVGKVGWVEKYGEYGTFGVMKDECVGEGISGEKNDEMEMQVKERIRDDPLFRMCRAECLLALFIREVEAPQLDEIGQEVAGGSAIDFIDEDRINSLFPLMD